MQIIFLVVVCKHKPIAIVFLFLLCPAVVPSIQAIPSNSQQWMTSIILAQQINTDTDTTEFQTTGTAIGSYPLNDSTKNDEIKNSLAQKAEMGQRKTGTGEDRFSSILFYVLSIGSIVLIIILIYFYLNLRHKGEHLKMLRRGMENKRLHKKAGS